MMKENNRKKKFMRKAGRFLAFTAMAGMLGLTASGCASKPAGGLAKNTSNKESSDLQTLRIGSMPNNADHYLAVIGKAKGFYEQQGIQLEITEFAAGINTVDAIATGQVDVGVLADYAVINRIGNTLDNCNLRIISNYSTSGSTSLYVDPKKISSLEDLAGQGFVTLPGTVWDYWTAATLNAGNVPKEERNIVNVDSVQSGVAVMISGEGAAFWTSGANAQKLKEQGMEALISQEDLGISTDQYHIVSTEYLQAHGDVIKGFLKGVKATEEWIEENPKEAAQIMEDEANVPKEQALQNFESIKYTLSMKEPAVEHLEEIKAWVVENEIIEKDYNMQDFIDVTLLKELYPEEVDE